MSNKNIIGYRFGPYLMDISKRLLLRDGEPVYLAPRAYELLRLLVENSGRVLHRNELLETLWPNSHVEEANLSVTISFLRKALEDTSRPSKYIETIAKIGYRFIPEVRQLSTEDDSTQRVMISDIINRISPTFTDIFQQSVIAEQNKLYEISLMGYRKALEILVTDYAVNKYPNEKNKIEKKSLADCIRDYLDHPLAKKIVLSVSRWIDEGVHNFRNLGVPPLKESKIVIGLVIRLIEIEAEVQQLELLLETPDLQDDTPSSNPSEIHQQ